MRTAFAYSPDPGLQAGLPAPDVAALAPRADPRPGQDLAGPIGQDSAPSADPSLSSATTIATTLIRTSVHTIVHTDTSTTKFSTPKVSLKKKIFEVEHDGF